MACAALLAADLGCAGTVLAAGEPQVPGWTVAQDSPPTGQLKICHASGPTDGRASLSLVAFGPGFLMLVSAPDFPTEKSSYRVSLAFDGKAPVQAVALGENGVIEVRLGTGDPARTVAGASSVSITVEGRTHVFSLRNAALAMDAAARCAGERGLSQQSDAPPKAIAGAGNWTMMRTLPGVAGRACSARITGDQIDTILLLNNDGQLLLIGGHSDWATFGGDVPLQLSIDGTEPVALTANTIENLIMVLIKDPALVQRLRSARTLDWTIPTGHVRGEVAGLGVALDAVKACKAGS